jgi:hypothetical protein
MNAQELELDTLQALNRGMLLLLEELLPYATSVHSMSEALELWATKCIGIARQLEDISKEIDKVA